MTKEKSKKDSKKQKKQTAEIEALEQEVQDYQTELEGAKDKYLRLFAEFENYKKRTTRERIELISTASESTMKALLPILDDFDRAKKSTQDDANDEVFTEGVELVYHKLFSTLEGRGLKKMDMGDLTFNEDLHDAITQLAVDDPSKDGKIIDVVEIGFTLNDKIIRFAKVVVGKA